MAYIIERDEMDDGDVTTFRFKNKDEVISELMFWLRGSHGEQLKLIYPDGWEG